KRAKKSLGIRSRRTGFGAGSQWLWELPRQTDPAPVKKESEAAQERRIPIPIDWVQGVAYLDPDHPPNDVPRLRWRQFVGDCKNFLSSSKNWANRAARLGWEAMALFGCAPKRPLDYLGSAGGFSSATEMSQAKAALPSAELPTPVIVAMSTSRVS